MRTIRPNRIPVLKDCAIPECREVALTKGLCRKHYQAMKKQEKRDKIALSQTLIPH